MSGPYGDRALCATLPQRELEATFFYPGPPLGKPPPSSAQRAWAVAKDMCLDCPLMPRCAQEHRGEEFGVWGGVDEHERHLERARQSQRLRRADAATQAARAARVVAMAAGRRGLPPQEVASRTGFSVKMVNSMIEAHQVSQPVREERTAPAAPAPVRREPRFPAGWPPEGDAWVWRTDRAYSGHVVVATPDRAFIQVKFRGGLKAHVIRWFPADQVQIRTQTAVPVKEWTGRPDGQARAA